MRITTVTTITSLFLLGTIALAQSVAYDYDKSMDFARIKTYAWVRGTVLADELNHRRIVNAVNGQLASKGLTKVETSANPDVFVAYHGSFDRDLQIAGFSSGWGGYRFGGNRTGTARAEEILIGSLLVDIVDARVKAIVWRAMATKEIDVKASPEKREKNITRAVEKLFANYPSFKTRSH